MHKRLFCLAALAGLIVTIGCGPAEEATTPVSGTVMYNDKPLEGAAVTFVPDSGIQAATGTTDAAGKFTLKTASKDGAVPGTYKVVVMKTSGGNKPPEAMSEEELKAMTLKSADSPQATAEDVDAMKSLIPEKYNSPATSGFEATVEEGKPNEFEFKLVD